MIKGAKLSKDNKWVIIGRYKRIKFKWSFGLTNYSRHKPFNDGQIKVGGVGVFKCRQTGEIRTLSYVINH